MDDQHQPLPEEREPELDPIDRARDLLAAAEQANQRVERLAAAQVGNS